jgi:hypothetical protein
MKMPPKNEKPAQRPNKWQTSACEHGSWFNLELSAHPGSGNLQVAQL